MLLQVQSLIATPLRTGARVIGSVGSAVGAVPNNLLQSANRLGKTMLGWRTLCFLPLTK